MGQLAPRAPRMAVFISLPQAKQMRADEAVAPVVRAALAATQEACEAVVFVSEAEAVAWLQAAAA